MLGSIPGVPGVAPAIPGLLWVAATRSGLTPWAAGWYIMPGWPVGAGVLVPPVGRGVVKAEGISDVKMVADGERMYFWVMTPRRAWAKPIHSNSQ